MFHLSDVMQLRTDEKVELLVRRHIGTVLPVLVPAGALIALPFFFLFSISKFGNVGWILLCLCVIMGIAMAIRVLWIWDADVCIITNQRMIHADQQGIWSRTVVEIPLTAIQDVAVLSTNFGSGNIRIRSSAVPSELILSHVMRPHSIKERLHEIAHLTLPSQPLEPFSSLEDFRRRLADRIKVADQASLDEVAKALAQNGKQENE